MEKRNSTMRIGLGKLGRATALLAEAAESKCGAVAAGAGALKALGHKLEGFGKDKAFIEYRKLEALKVGGHDIHKELNEFIGAWKKDFANGKDVGQALGRLFNVFKDKKKDEL